MEKKLDKLLKHALTPTDEPDFWLNQKLLRTAKEVGTVSEKKKKIRRVPEGIIAAVVTLMVGSLGVCAGWKYLTPDKVAEEFKYQQLSQAFQTENAIFINETQEYAGYQITLLGIVSGEALSAYTIWDEQENIVSDRTYVITVIENADGTPRPAVTDEAYGTDTFFVSPYIRGMNPREYNAFTLSGGYSEAVIDGIQYRISECDNVEIFAHRGLYLGVSDGSFYNADAFVIDEVTGEISRNESYIGLNALFDLPIPEEKGDETAAEAYVESLSSPKVAEKTKGEQSERLEHLSENMVDSIEATENAVEAVRNAVRDWTLEDFEVNATCVVKQILNPNADGYISYSYELENGRGREATLSLEYLLAEGRLGLSLSRVIYDEDAVYVETFECCQDGSIVLRVYLIEDK